MNSDLVQLFWASTFVLALAVHLALLSRHRRSLTFQDIHLLMFYLWMGATVFLAYASSDFGLPPFSEGAVSKAYISMWLYIVGILATKRLNGRILTVDGDGTSNEVSALYYVAQKVNRIPIYLVVGAMLFALFTNITGFFIYGFSFYAAGTADAMLSIPYPVFVLTLVTTLGLIPAMFFWAWCVIFSNSPAKTVALFVILETVLFALMKLSRSEIIFDATLIGLAYVLTAPKLSVKALAGWSLAVLAMYFCVIPAIFGIRVAGQNISNSGSGVQHLVDSVEAWWSGRYDFITSNAVKKNLASRTLIVAFNYSVADGLETHSPMYGAALWSSILAVIPRVFYFGATKTMYSSEGAIQLYFTGSATDTSDNWAVTGLADFGVFGGLLIGLLFGCCQAVGHRLLKATADWTPFFSICIIGEYLNSLIFAEQAPEVMWASFRDLTLIFIGLTAIGYFVKLQKDEHALNVPVLDGNG